MNAVLQVVSDCGIRLHFFTDNIEFTLVKLCDIINFFNYYFFEWECSGVNDLQNMFLIV